MRLNPPDDSGDEADGGEVVSGQPVIAGCDTPEVFETAESVLYAMAGPSVGSPVEYERLLAVGLVRNDRRCSALDEPSAQFGALS